MSLSMGQYRYSGGGCVSNLTLNKRYYTPNVLDSDSTSSSFKDIELTLGGGALFEENKDYYLSLSIPQDINYDMTLNIKLIKKENNATIAYQFLKSIIIPKGSNSGSNVYTVMLYGVPANPSEGVNQEVFSAIPKTYNATFASEENEIYFDSTTGKVYLGNDSGGYTLTDDFNKVSIEANWKKDQSDTVKNINTEITFRPVESNFSGILLEMVRSAEDYSIQEIQEDGSMEYGRKIDIDKLQCQLYSLTELNGAITGGIPFARIGVWSHPGLIMMINGEEIQVGPSGYYELDAIPITSLGVAAFGWQDNFSIDYTFMTP